MAAKPYQEFLKNYGILEGDDGKPDNTKLNYSYDIMTPISLRTVEQVLSDKRKPDIFPTYTMQTGVRCENEKVLVLFMGPITHAEAAGFEVLRKNLNELTVVCTDVLSGEAIMRQVNEVQ